MLDGIDGARVALVGLLCLGLALVLVDPLSAALMLVYLFWVVGYDVPWIYQLWRANPVPPEDAAKA